MADVCEFCRRPLATDAEWEVDHGDCDGCSWCASRCWQSADCDVRAEAIREREAKAGRALLALVSQIKRLRMNPCPTMGFGFTCSEIATSVEAEVNEVRAEDPCSPAARIETAGVIGTALHLALVHGADPVEAIEGEAVKLRRRLDVVEAGGTWVEAKALERAEADHG